MLFCFNIVFSSQVSSTCFVSKLVAFHKYLQHVVLFQYCFPFTSILNTEIGGGGGRWGGGGHLQRNNEMQRNYFLDPDILSTVVERKFHKLALTKLNMLKCTHDLFNGR